MSDKKSNNRRNNVIITGYLKENNLELITNSRGENVIRGSIIIATSEVASHRVSFYVSEKTKSGETSKNYENLVDLLPDKTITVASFLQDNPTATFATASNAASKVWARARFEEYAYRIGERETSKMTLKGSTAGFKTISEKSPFNPGSKFELDVYINEFIKEVDSTNNEDTGRVIVDALIPDEYNSIVHKINLLLDTDTVKFVTANYKVGDTAFFSGVIEPIEYQVISKPAIEQGFGFASSSDEDPQYVTRFYTRRVIKGNVYGKDHVAPIHDGEEGSITSAFVKDALANREIKMEQVGNKVNGTAPAAAPVAAPVVKKETKKDDFDFDGGDF